MRQKCNVVLFPVLMTALLYGSGNCRGADSTLELLQVLREWEQTTAEFPKPLPDAAFPDSFESHTAHELDVAAQLYGAVTAQELIENFNWSMESTTQTTVVLKGFPRDEISQLFYSAFEITLDRQSMRPTSIQFLDVDGVTRAQEVRLRINVTRNSREPGLTDANVRNVAADRVNPDERNSNEPSAELGAVLDRWVAATREIRAAELRFRRYVYDSIYEQEIRGQGSFVFESPGRGMYRVRPVELTAGATSQRTSASGKAFEMVPDESISCYWTGTHLVLVNEQQRSYEKLQLPESRDADIRTVGSWDRVWAGWAGPQRALPGVIDVHTDDFIERFEWSLLSQSGRQVIVQGRPISEEDRFHLSLLQVVLDRESWLTSATRMIDAGGNRETVHVFEHVRTNRAPTADRADWEPDLSRYREQTGPPPAPPAEIED